MIGNRKSKLTAVVSTLLAGVFLMSACSVNMNGVGKAFSDLGEDLSEKLHRSLQQHLFLRQLPHLLPHLFPRELISRISQQMH